MAKLSKRSWFGLGGGAFAFGAQFLDLPVMVKAGIAAIAVGYGIVCFAIGLWKWLGGFQYNVPRRRVKALRMLRAMFVALLVIVIGLGAVNAWLFRRGPRGPLDLPATQVIRRHKFHNEIVEIDGKVFDHCDFENVTFMYRGTGQFLFLDLAIRGTITFRTNNDQATRFIKLIDSARNHPEKIVTKIESGEVGPDGQFHPVTQFDWTRKP